MNHNYGFINYPMRKVVTPYLKEGNTIVNGFPVRWWRLTLECGHTTERGVKYDHTETKKAGRRVPKGLSDDVEPPTETQSKTSTEAGKVRILPA